METMKDIESYIESFYIEDEDDLVGKTIKCLETSFYGDFGFIVFTDNTFTTFKSSYSVDTNFRPIYFDDVIHYIHRDKWFLTQLEHHTDFNYEKIKEALVEIAKNEVTKSELKEKELRYKMFLELKNEFEK